jgi:hypothetical protein
MEVADLPSKTVPISTDLAAAIRLDAIAAALAGMPACHLGEFHTDRALRILLPQCGGFVPPRLGSLAVIGRVPVLRHRFTVRV